MKSKILIAIVLIAISSCQNKEKTKSNIIKTIAEDTLSKTVAGTADVSDAPPKDDKATELMQNQ